MATVDKNFRIKNGLVVEGTTATVNSSNVLTEASTTFLNNLIEDTAGALLEGATLTNIAISYDDATNALTITAENGVGDSTTDDLSEGATNLYFTDERAQDAFGTLVTNGTYTGATVTYDDANNALNISITDQFTSHDTDDLAEGATNLYFTDQRALDATNSAYDASGAAATAESNANTYTDNLIGDGTVDGTAGNTVADRISTAVSNLIDSAPSTLDTLNELAAALNDDASFSTTVTNSIAEKVSKAGDTMTGDLTLAQDPTSNLHAATKQYVDSEIPDNTDGLTEGSSNLYFTDQRAVDALEAVVPDFTAVDINSVSRQIAATINLANTSQTAVYSFAKSAYRSAKFVVKAAYSTHTEVSEVIVTLDTSDNIAITEYGVVGTNGSLGSVTAGINGANVELLYTAGTANTDVTVFGTLIA